MSEDQAICVYCGAATGEDPVFVEAAKDFGALIARRGFRLVYGGGHIGLMGVVADAALLAGGEVEGVIPQSMVDKELAHQGITELHIVESMHDRKALMAQLSDAFVALPGGIGTLDELFEIWTWRQIGLHGKPIGLLNVKNYWAPLLELADNMDEQGFLHRNARDMIISDSDGAKLLDMLLA